MFNINYSGLAYFSPIPSSVTTILNDYYCLEYEMNKFDSFNNLKSRESILNYS